MNDKIAFSIVDFKENELVSKDFLTNKHIKYICSNPNLSNEARTEVIEMYSKVVTYNDNGFHIGKDYRGIYLEFNPNKVTNTAPTEQMNFGRFKEALNIASKKLNDIGVDCNIDNAKVIKYHQCYDVKPTERYKYFLPTILSLKPKRQISKSDKKIIENSFYMQNKTEQVTIYNKQKEAQLPFNCIRFEHRKNNIPKADRFLLGSLNDDYFRYLQDNSYRIINSTVFDYLIDNRIEKELNLSSLVLSLVSNNYSAADIEKHVFALSLNNDLNDRQITDNQLFKSINSRNDDGTRNKQYTTIQTIKKILNSYKTMPYDCIEPYRKLYELYKLAKVA